MKFCKDCRFRPLKIMDTIFAGTKYARCTHPHSYQNNDAELDHQVTGSPIRKKLDDFMHCLTMRKDFHEGLCGKDGKYWEAKK